MSLSPERGRASQPTPSPPTPRMNSSFNIDSISRYTSAETQRAKSRLICISHLGFDEKPQRRAKKLSFDVAELFAPPPPSLQIRGKTPQTPAN
ncbi:hypothetical protein U1Q18_051147 [Sarracenia purpurea var. burkii]